MTGTTNIEFRWDNFKCELEEQGGGCMTATPGMRSDED
jgi:hypothetical protein